MRMLLIENNRKEIGKIRSGFEKDFIIDVTENGSEGMFLSEANEYDIMIIDFDLADINGVEICKMIRSSSLITPIILIIDISKYHERVMSFDVGVDAVLSKPLNIEELFGQVNVLVRRNGCTSNCKNIIEVGEIKLDMRKRLFFVNDNPIYLRRKEYDILQYLLINRERVISAEELLEHVWEAGIGIISNTVEVHIRQIRVRFDKILGKNIIKTVRGFGYKIET